MFVYLCSFLVGVSVFVICCALWYSFLEALREPLALFIGILCFGLGEFVCVFVGVIELFVLFTSYCLGFRCCLMQSLI